MKFASKDARGFVDGVVSHLKKSGKGNSIAPKVQSLLLKMTTTAKREHQATVESSVKLTPPEMAAIARLLARLSGHDVSLTNVINRSLIGGLRITMGDWVVDTSVKNELNRMASMIIS